MPNIDVPVTVQLGCDMCHQFLLAKTAEHQREVEHLRAELREAVVYVSERNHMEAHDDIRAWLMRNA